MILRAPARARRVLSRTAFFALACFSACVYDKADHPAACKKTSECTQDERCIDQFCVPNAKPSNGSKTDGGNSNVDAGGKMDAGGGKMDAGGGKMDAGSKMDAASSGDSGMSGGDRCVSGQSPENCYEGAMGTADVGICKSGQRACIGGIYTQCLGQVLPADEGCNGKDDDCDGKTDEIAMNSDCETVMPGACKAGRLMCRGTFAVCEVVHPPVDESCNGQDDDCDNKTDEVASSACYPANTAGCNIAADGTVTCSGLCHAGTTACTNGQSACTGAVTPMTETCTTTGLAADEDCDSKIDEGCVCTNGQTSDCYAGAMGTETTPPCHVGTRTCANSAWGDCQNQRVPEQETCLNQGVDDDCDTMVDNVLTLGDVCHDDTKNGICRDGTNQCASAGTATPSCVTATATQEQCDDLDQDCDGNPINGFDLNSDPLNCGRCGNKCDTSSQTCCEGSCIDLKQFDTDELNCGSCGHSCGHGAYCCQGDCLGAPNGGTGGKGGTLLLCACQQDCGRDSCCGTNCVNLSSDEKNCGTCGNVCASGQVCCGSRGCVTSTLCVIKL